MAISKEVSFADGVTIVSAAWLNLIQEHLAGFVNLLVEAATPTQIRISANSDNDVASVYIGGEMRRRETNLTHNMVGSANTYNVYVTGDSADDLFGIEVVTGAAVAANSRKVAEVDWNGAAITAIRMIRGRQEAHDHSEFSPSGPVSHGDLSGLTTGDPHTQYSRADGTRPFTNPVTGVTPVAGSDLATKGYVDGLSASGVPAGTILPFAGAATPGGWLLCNGGSHAQATYPDLFAVIGTTFGGGGANFNVPDFRQRFPMGVAASGTGSTLGSSGGVIDHTHTQPSHSHSETAHSHTTSNHNHSVPTTDAAGDHTHTQSATGAAGTHTHIGPLHTHSGTSLAVGVTGDASGTSRVGGAGTVGLFSKNDVSNSSSASHSHSDGTYAAGGFSVTGTSSSASASHSHVPSVNAYGHDHASGPVVGSTGSAGNGVTTSNPGDHTHSNPTTSTNGDHTHTFSASTGNAAPSTNSGGGGTTSSDGNDATGSANPPYLAVNFIIKT